MHIFIDETGTFTGIGQPLSISMIGALIVPDKRLRSLEKEYAKVRKSLPTQNGEVKGKKLLEKDIAKLLPILRHHDVIFEVAAIDLGLHTEEGIRKNQAGRAEGMTANLTEEHHQTLVDAIWKARRELESYSLQLNIQSAIIFELVRTVIEHGTMYYSQRRPEELTNFHWIIDAKGDNSIPTPWEKWWTMFIKPALQTKFARDPIASLKIGDYSHMKRFVFDTVSEFHQKVLKPKPGGPRPMNLGLVLSESLRFSKDPEPGLELVDILTNATRRALRGNLQVEGWLEIPTIIVNRNPHNIHLLSLDDTVPETVKLPYGHIVKAFDIGAKSMLTAANQKKDW
ncbi:hypothetical protein FXB40_13665 [Bradyrhizobium rifense]|uniref:DUF3800 domain-containing protein n=1 Tax=Bradyrhizobium rifense TaxID=515499 RepID=A0A5D3KGR8_9BRAD|nr:hypothetical protein [Bradyrhizobium rifense]TYL95954.1 hypothetical protein FXB40_13665 [Bradyrhizobium rifense]